MEDDSSLFHDPPVTVSLSGENAISPELLWYLSDHPEEDEGSNRAPDGPPDLPSTPPTNSWTLITSRLSPRPSLMTFQWNGVALNVTEKNTLMTL